MRVTPNTVKAAGTVTATIGAGLSGSTLPGGAAVGSAMTSYGTSVLGGHVIAAAAPFVVPVALTAGAVVATVAAANWLSEKFG